MGVNADCRAVDSRKRADRLANEVRISRGIEQRKMNALVFTMRDLGFENRCFVRSILLYTVTWGMAARLATGHNPEGSSANFLL